jgi:hypothetical protein
MGFSLVVLSGGHCVLRKVRSYWQKRNTLTYSGIPHAIRSSSSSVDHLHLSPVVVVAGGRSEVVELVKLLSGEFELVGGDVFLHTIDPFGARNWRDVVALGQQPGQCNLCWRGADLGRDFLDFADDAQVVLKVVPGESWVCLRKSLSAKSSSDRTFPVRKPRPNGA